MKFKLTFALIGLILLFNINVFAQKDTIPQAIEPIQPEVESYLNIFTTMHISYYGSTQNCEAYDIYTLKYKRNWFLIVNAGNKISFMHINSPFSEDAIVYPSSYFAEGVAKCHSLGYTKLKKRKKTVNDMDIYGYYKFNKYGRKVIKGLLYLEYPYYTKGFWRWKVDEEKAMEIVEEKFKNEMEPKQLETIKKEINQIQEELPIEEVPVEKK